MSWLRAHRGVVIAIAAALSLQVGFAALASEVLEDETTAFDQTVLRAFRDANGMPVGPTWLKGTVLNLSALGSVAVVTLIVALAAIFLVLVKRRWEAVLLVACSVGATITLVVLKILFGRERPTVVSALAKEVDLSFPSGHSLIASAIYPTLGLILARTLTDRHLKVFVLAAAAGLTLMIGFTRVYIGVHYPTDVLGGWMLGLSWAILCALISHRLRPQDSLSQPS
jgi:undecaprenyl-diphosphatase